MSERRLAEPGRFLYTPLFTRDIFILQNGNTDEVNYLFICLSSIFKVRFQIHVLRTKIGRLHFIGKVEEFKLYCGC